MRLTAKLVATIVLGIIIMIAADTTLSVRRAVAMFERDMRDDADVAADLMRPVLEDEWTTNGVEHAMTIVEEANREGRLLQFRWVWLDADDDDPLRPQISRDRLDSVMQGSDASFKGRGRDGQECLFTYAPLSVVDERPAALELSESTAPIGDFARSIRRKAVALGTISIVFGAGVVGSLGVLMVGRPLHETVAKVRRVAAGRLDDPLTVRGHDELAELGEAVNSMCKDLAAARDRVQRETTERIKAIEQLRHADRLATVGTLASGIAHELGTPLNVVMGRAGLIAREPLPQEEVVESAEIIRAQTARMTAIIRQVLAFARREVPTTSRIDVRDLLDNCAKLLRTTARTSGVEIELLPGAAVPPVSADPGQLQQVFTNLLMNAIQAMPAGGRVELALARAHARPPKGHDGHEGEFLRIDVKDQGEGIPEEVRVHVFDPFFTTKDVGEGTGLGLSIAYGIIAERGGWIDVTSRPGEGSCFSVYLPVEMSPCSAAC